MKFNCPYCNKQLNYIDLQISADLLAIIRMSQDFGRHANVVMGYCQLFGISPLHVKSKKLRILLEEMRRLFEAEAFVFQKQKYAISQAGIAEALDVLVKRNFGKPLTNHNYLKQVMIDIAEREVQARSKEAEKALRKKEERLMYPIRDEQVIIGGDQTAGAVAKVEPADPDAGDDGRPSPEQIAAKDLLVQSFLKKIGG